MNTSQTMMNAPITKLACHRRMSALLMSPVNYYPMQGFNRVLAAAVTDALAVDDVVSVQLLQATDDSGTGSKTLGSAVQVTATEAIAYTVLAEAKASDLDDGFTHVAVQISATPDGATTINGAVTLIRGDGSYRP